jgi:hypothetical protein
MEERTQYQVVLETECGNEFSLTLWALSYGKARKEANRLSKGCKVKHVWAL